MPDDLYHRDILVWSESQAALLRRLARGERVNDVDWEHVAEEIEDVGRSELNAVHSHLRLLIVHLLKIRGWPDSASVGHWRGEVVAFQQDARRRFAPSMRRKIDVAEAYADALEQVDAATYDDAPPRPWPAQCPFSLDELLNDKRATLDARLTAASPAV